MLRASLFLKTAAAFALLCALSWGGEYAQKMLHVPVPGPVLGMSLLLVLLFLVPRLGEFLSDCAQFLVRWLGLMIVPAAVGLMNYGSLFSAHGLALAAVLIITTLITGAVFALVYQWSAR